MRTHERNRFDSTKRKALMAVIGCIFLCLEAICFSAEVDDRLVEIEDDAKKTQSIVRKILKKDSRFLLVPIPVSDPTIGTGLALSGIYLHPRKSENDQSPTTISGVAGLYTSTDSWATGVFHDGFYRDDQIRFRVVAGYGEFNLDFFGIGSDSPLQENPIQFGAKTFTFIPRLLFESPVNNLFLGGQYSYLNVTNVFDLSRLRPSLPEIEAQTQTGGLGLVALYDSRDNNTWPGRGTLLDATLSAFNNYFGGDFDYRKLTLKFAQYFPFRDTINFVYRLDGQFIDGDAPFYDLSRIRLRGYSGLSLLDNHAVSAQAEVRWNLYKRWTILAFGGGGRIAADIDDLTSAPTNYAGGAGIRYRVDERSKLNIGIDFAYANGEAVFYVQVGDWLAN